MFKTGFLATAIALMPISTMANDIISEYCIIIDQTTENGEARLYRVDYNVIDETVLIGNPEGTDMAIGQYICLSSPSNEDIESCFIRGQDEDGNHIMGATSYRQLALNKTQILIYDNYDFLEDGLEGFYRKTVTASGFCYIP